MLISEIIYSVQGDGELVLYCEHIQTVKYHNAIASGATPK